jgi:hypothetical protein
VEVRFHGQVGPLLGGLEAPGCCCTEEDAPDVLPSYGKVMDALISFGPASLGSRESHQHFIKTNRIVNPCVFHFPRCCKGVWRTLQTQPNPTKSD